MKKHGGEDLGGVTLRVQKTTREQGTKREFGGRLRCQVGPWEMGGHTKTLGLQETSKKKTGSMEVEKS